MVNSKILSLSFSVRYRASRLVKPINFLIFSLNALILRNIDIGSITFVNSPEVTHKIYKIIGTELVFETFDFQDS